MSGTVEEPKKKRRGRPRIRPIPETPYVPYTKVGRGVRLLAQARILVIAVYEYFLAEKCNGGPLIPVQKANERTAAALRINKNTVSHIVCENKTLKSEAKVESLKLITPDTLKQKTENLPSTSSQPLITSLPLNAENIDTAAPHLQLKREDELPTIKQEELVLEDYGGVDQPVECLINPGDGVPDKVSASILYSSQTLSQPQPQPIPFETVLCTGPLPQIKQEIVEEEVDVFAGPSKTNPLQEPTVGVGYIRPRADLTVNTINWPGPSQAQATAYQGNVSYSLIQCSAPAAQPPKDPFMPSLSDDDDLEEVLISLRKIPRAKRKITKQRLFEFVDLIADHNLDPLCVKFSVLRL